jgi:hypothetical protein
MAVALHQYALQLDEDMRNAVESFCTPQNLGRIVESEAHKWLDIVLREEVTAWFFTGAGREVIRKAVEAKLAAGETWTPLDEKWQP